jgi:hypothetical protein
MLSLIAVTAPAFFYADRKGVTGTIILREHRPGSGDSALRNFTKRWHKAYVCLMKAEGRGREIVILASGVPICGNKQIISLELDRAVYQLTAIQCFKS